MIAIIVQTEFFAIREIAPKKNDKNTSYDIIVKFTFA